MPDSASKELRETKIIRRCFFSYPRALVRDEIVVEVERIVRSSGFRISRLDELLSPGAPLNDVVIGEIARADCVVADISGSNPSVLFAIGSAMAMNKAVFLL